MTQVVSIDNLFYFPDNMSETEIRGHVAESLASMYYDLELTIEHEEDEE